MVLRSHDVLAYHSHDSMHSPACLCMVLAGGLGNPAGHQNPEILDVLAVLHSPV